MLLITSFFQCQLSKRIINDALVNSKKAIPSVLGFYLFGRVFALVNNSKMTNNNNTSSAPFKQIRYLLTCDTQMIRKCLKHTKPKISTLEIFFSLLPYYRWQIFGITLLSAEASDCLKEIYNTLRKYMTYDILLCIFGSNQYYYYY